MPIWLKECAGQPYRPSNGTEGECFHSMWCEKCERDNAMNGRLPPNVEPDENDYCEILNRSFRDDPLPEWVFGDDGRPKCTAFVRMGDGLPLPRCEHTDDLFGSEHA